MPGATKFHLPESIRRVVIVGGINSCGASYAASLATSPFLRKDHEIIVTDTPVAPFTNAEGAVTDPLTTTIVNEHDVQRRTQYLIGKFNETFAALKEGMLKRRSSKSDLPVQYFSGSIDPPSEALPSLFSRVRVVPRYNVKVSSDLIICVATDDAVDAELGDCVDHLIAWLPAFSTNKSLSDAHLLILAEDRSRQRLASVVDQLKPCCPVVCIWAPLLAPPGLDFGATDAFVRSAKGLQSVLPALCAGVALGVTRTFAAPRSAGAPLIPVDLALNVGMLAFSAFHRKILPPLDARNPKLTTLSIECPLPKSLVWGMVGEYIMDYYGRYAPAICEAFPFRNAVVPNPSLQFPFSVHDTLNFGIDSGIPFQCGEAWSANRRRRSILQGAPSLSRELKLDQLLATLERLNREAVVLARRRNHEHLPAHLIGTISLHHKAKVPSPEPASSFHNGGYLFLIRKLSADYEAYPLLQYVSLNEVDWGMFIRTVARSVLGHLSERWYKAERVSYFFPRPTREFMNDFVFYGPSRTPPFPSMARWLAGDLDWVCRAGLTASGHRGQMDAGITSRHLVELMAQPDVARAISSVALEEGLSREEVAARARKMFLRIGDTLNHPQCRTTGLLVRQVLFKIYEKVNFNHDAFERLSRLYNMPRVQLVFLPLHRSYTDFLVLTYVLVVMGFSAPHIVTGEDFLGMGKLVSFLRGSGSFFMRRSFRGDPLYSVIFKEYVRQLVLRRQPLEFFIEGMRSRSGKTMVPKLGILKFISDAFFTPQAELEDVLFVPVSLSYDELPEAKVYAQECLGIPKPKETVSNMIKAALSLHHLYGNVNMNIGEAISLRNLQKNATQCPAPFKPKKQAEVKVVAPVTPAPPPPPGHASLAVAEGKKGIPVPLLHALAWRIGYELQHNIIISPPSVVAAILECLGPYHGVSDPYGEMSVAHITDDVEWLRACLQKRQGNLSDALASLPKEELVQVALSHLSFFVHHDVERDAVFISPPTPTSKLGVSISMNQLIHIFVDEALVAVVARGYGKAVSKACVIPRGELGARVRQLQQLLAREFPNYLPSNPCDFDSCLDYAITRIGYGEEERAAMAATPHTPHEVVIPTTTRLYHFLTGLLFPHIDSIFMVVVALQVFFREFPETPVSGKAVVLAAHHTAMQSLENVISCSRETLQHYFETMVGMSLLVLRRSEKNEILYAEAKNGTDGALSKLIKLQTEVNRLRRSPSKDLKADYEKLRKSLLQEYSKAVNKAKM